MLRMRTPYATAECWSSMAHTGQGECLIHQLPRHRLGQKQPRRMALSDRLIKVQHGGFSSGGGKSPYAADGEPPSWCRASFFHWRLEGSPLTLQQHHDEPGRL